MADKACKYCGQGGLEWTRIEGRFRLKDPATAGLHSCLKKGGSFTVPLEKDKSVAPTLADLAKRYDKPFNAPRIEEPTEGDLMEPTSSSPSILEALLAEL